MRDLARYLRYNLGILYRKDLLLLVIPTALVGLVGAWTWSVIEGDAWHPSIAVAQSESLGSLVALFLFAGLLDPETRHGARELVFSKPHPMGLLLGVRMGIALSAAGALMLTLLLFYQRNYGDACVGDALRLGLPSWLAMGLVSFTIGQRTRSAVGGISASLVLWLWLVSAGAVFNPVLNLVGGATSASLPYDASLAALLRANKASQLLLTALLFLMGARRLLHNGAEVQANSGGPLRWLAPAGKWLVVAVVYLWTGALAHYLVACYSNPPDALRGLDLEAAPFGAAALAPSNWALSQLGDVCKMLPMAWPLGPGASDLLKALGGGEMRVGAMGDPTELLESAAAAPGPGQRPARLELAYRLAVGAGVGPYRGRQGASTAVWLTIGLADPDRWWIARLVPGPNVPRAEQLCEQVLRSKPTEAQGADALNLLAALAHQRWQFDREWSLNRRLVEQFPGSARAGELVWQAADGLRPQAVAVLFVRVAERQPLASRLQIYSFLARYRRSVGDRGGAEESQRKQREAWEGRERWRAAKSSNRSSNWMASERIGAAPGVPMHDALTPRAAEQAPGPTCPVTAAVLARGRPIPGVGVALFPLGIRRSEAPRALVNGWDRASSSAPVSEVPGPGGVEGSHPWGQAGTDSSLSRHPYLVAHTDAGGIARWRGVPAGRYILLVRLESRQLGDPANLSLVPPQGPVTVHPDRSGQGIRLPAIRFEPRIRLTSSAGPQGLPQIRWTEVPGAATYRVSLRCSDAWPLDSLGAAIGGTASPCLAHDLVWWRNDVRGPSSALLPEGFVGPSLDLARSGTTEGAAYWWCVEAKDAAGQSLAISEPLSAPRPVRMPSWQAIAQLGKAKEQMALREAAARHAADSSAEDEEREMSAFSSPFLEALMPPKAEAAAPRRGAARILKVPPMEFPGRGLPPRGPL
ncbi:MAG TPA: hypothetical protein VGN26_01950 [Armatimonadota bacterium]